MEHLPIDLDDESGLGSSFDSCPRSTISSVQSSDLYEQTDSDTTNQIQYNGNTYDSGVISELISLYLKNNLTLSCLEDMFSLTAKLVQNPNLPTSKYRILKLLNCADFVTYYIECKNCGIYNKHTDQKCDDCVCKKCHSILRAVETNFFLYINA